MNILIICSYYPPDAGIAAVRPYMFSKYLAQKGHNITVLCPGGSERNDDKLLKCQDLGIQIRHYLQNGNTNAAVSLSRPDLMGQGPKKLSFLPEFIRRPLKKVYHIVDKPVKIIRPYMASKERLGLLKACIDELESQNFDIVFATYAELENIFAGKYAAEKLKCKWVMDFRDPVAQRRVHGWLRYPILRKLEKDTILSADVCTAVSHGVANLMTAGTSGNVITLYNGYDASENQEQKVERDDVLRFVYTGTIYYGEQSCAMLFRVIRHLQEVAKLDIRKVRLEYAGPHFKMLVDEASEYGLESILVNHGYIDRKAVIDLQKQCDVYLVLSWNTKDSQGVITGKFYEGIRAHKPILALVTGAEPNSELFAMNERYHYGFCHEESAGENGFEQLCRWVETAYRNRQKKEPVPYCPEKSLYEDFRYDNLADKLEEICLNLMECS